MSCLARSLRWGVVGIVMILLFPVVVQSQSYTQARSDSIVAFIEANYGTNWDAIPDSARLLLDIAEELENDPNMASAHKYLGVYYFRSSKQDSSIFHYSKAAAINKRLDNKLELAKNTLNIGMSYRELGEFEKTIEYSLEAARVFEEVDDYKGMAIVYNMVGSVYYYQRRFEEAIPYMEKYLENAELSKDKLEIASANQNLGAILNAAGKDLEAVTYLDEARKLHLQNGNKLGGASNAINVGTIYIKRARFSESVEYFLQAYAIGKEMGNKRLLTQANVNLALAYVELNNSTEALRYANEGLADAREIKDPYIEMKLLKQVSLANALRNNYKKAFEVQGEYEVLKDEIINEENLKNIAELEALYEDEKKGKQIVELEKEKALQELTIQKNRVLQYGLGASLFLLIIAGFLWQSKVKQRELAFKVEQLEVDKKIQTERERISRDLHDNVGAQLINIISGLDLFDRYRKKEKEDQALRVLGSLKDEAQTSIGQLRDTIWALKSEENTPESLIEHLNTYLQKVESISELQVTTSIDSLAELDLTPSQSLNIFRIIQEAIQNIIKHAGASEVKLVAETDSSNAIITITDNGTFKAGGEGTNSGLANMKKRARDIGGDVEIKPSDAGTSVVLKFPTSKSKIAV